MAQDNKYPKVKGAHEGDRSFPGGLAEKILRIGRRCAALPDLDNRSADEVLGYDENGLPS
jgi:antitoxin VapB